MWLIYTMKQQMPRHIQVPFLCHDCYIVWGNQSHWHVSIRLVQSYRGKGQWIDTLSKKIFFTIYIVVHMTFSVACCGDNPFYPVCFYYYWSVFHNNIGLGWMKPSPNVTGFDKTRLPHTCVWKSGFIKSGHK